MSSTNKPLVRSSTGSTKKKYQKPAVKTEKLTAVAAVCNGAKRKNTLGVGSCVNGAKS